MDGGTTGMDGGTVGMDGGMPAVRDAEGWAQGSPCSGWHLPQPVPKSGPFHGGISHRPHSHSTRRASQSPLLRDAGSGAEVSRCERCSWSLQGCTHTGQGLGTRRGRGRVGTPLGSPDAEEGSGFVHLDITHGAVLVRLQVADDAGFAD